MIRIIHLINAFHPGGIETWLLRMLKQIPRQRFAMDFICKGTDTGPRADDARRLGASVLHYPLRPSHVEFLSGIRNTLRTGNYDLVHNHLDVTGGPAVWVAQRAGVPVISSFHNTCFAPQTWTRLPGFRRLHAAYSRVSIAFSLAHSTAITGCSKAVLDRVMQDWTEEDRYRLLYYGVESHPRATSEERKAFRRSLGVGHDAPILLHVGRFFAQKNHAGLLRIFRTIRKFEPAAQLVLVGDGPLRSEIESLICKMRLGESVHLLGMRDDVPQVMTTADVMLFPSFHEGLPVVSLESGACGLPFVGSNIPGTDESIIDGKTGLLHEVDHEEEMARSVLRILRDPQLAATLRSAAYERVTQQFSSTASAESLQRLYRDVLNGGRGELVTPPMNFAA